MSLSHSADPPGSQATVSEGHLAAHITAGMSAPFVRLDSSAPGLWLPAGTPSVNPGVAPRELSGTQLQSENTGAG